MMEKLIFRREAILFSIFLLLKLARWQLVGALVSVIITQKRSKMTLNGLTEIRLEINLSV